MLNKAIVQGRLVDDVVTIPLASGSCVASFTLASERDYKDKKTGKREVDFIDVEAKGTLAEFIVKTFKKGDTAIVSGRLYRHKYDDSTGVSRSSLKINCEDIHFC